MVQEDIRWQITQMSNEADKHGIIRLRQRTFTDEDYDKEQVGFWDWEFKDNYAGKAKIFLAIDKDKIVGHYAVCPSKIMLNGEEKTGSIVVDVMTDPDYRYQGMFTRLGRFSLDESGKQGVEFSYGFPIRKEVMPGHLKVGWKIAFPLPVYVYPINFYKIIKKFVRLGFPSFLLMLIPQGFYKLYETIRNIGIPRYRVKMSEKFENSKELGLFIEKTKNQHRIIQPRNYEFLNWRYNKNKYRKYHIISLYEDTELKGYVNVRNSEIYGLECVTIIDIQALDFDKGVIRRLLKEVREFAKKQNAALVGVMINNNEYKKQMLRELYIKSPYIFKMIIHENSDIDYMNKLMVNKNWYLTWGDTDDL